MSCAPVSRRASGRVSLGVRLVTLAATAGFLSGFRFRGFSVQGSRNRKGPRTSWVRGPSSFGNLKYSDSRRTRLDDEDEPENEDAKDAPNTTHKVRQADFGAAEPWVVVRGGHTESL